MARLIKPCKVCGKPLEQKSRAEFSDGSAFIEYVCGHIFLEEKFQTFSNVLKPEDWFPTVSNGESMYEFQAEGVEFFASNDFNGINGDPMGLGKTIQALKALIAFKNVMGRNPKVLILVKSATIWQWLEEYKKWVSPSLTGVFVIPNGKNWIPPGFDTYLLSMDMLSKFVVEKASKNKDAYETRSAAYFGTSSMKQYEIHENIKEHGFEFLIVDEAHSFKNPEAKRSASLVNFIALANIKHIIFLSGTPIKNRAEEFFVPLNIFFPDRIRSLRQFRENWLMQDSSGKWSRVRPDRMEAFQEMLSEIYIRRSKSILNLPPFRRAFELIHVEDEKFKKAYNQCIGELEDAIGGREKFSFQDVQAPLMAMRRIIGMAKVDFAVEYVDTFLETSDPEEKLAIGIHHHAVRDTLFAGLKNRGIGVLKMSGEDSAEAKDRIKKEFAKPENRVLIVNILAGGVGLNLQMCSNVLVLEREWSAADEEQFEGRFWRNGQKNPVYAEYFVIKGVPLEEMLHSLVEQKRAICKETLEFNLTEDGNALMDIVRATVGSRLK